MYHRVTDGSGSGTRTRHAKSGNGDAGGDIDRLHMLSQSMSPVPFAEGINGAEGLQGISPGSGQGTYAAQLRSPCPHSHQSALEVECSTGSILDATSPRCGEEGVGGSILSPGVDSVETASSLWMHEEEETGGAWKDDENKGGENENWGGGDEEMGDEGDSTAKGWEEGQEEQSDHGRRQFSLLDEEEARVASAAPGDARCPSSRQERGPATR